MSVQTFDVERQAESLYVEVSSVANVTREAVLSVLKLIAMDYPEITDELFMEIRHQVEIALIVNITHVKKSAYPMLVVCDLEENGTLKKEAIPDEIVIPDSVMQKMAILDAQEEYRKIIAHIILNSTTKSDVNKKLNASNFCAADATQLLMPLLHALIKIDSTIKQKVKDELNALEAVKVLSDVPDFLENYCFNEANTQPYVMVTMRYGDRISDAARKELLESFIEVMLEVLSKYLLS